MKLINKLGFSTIFPAVAMVVFVAAVLILRATFFTPVVVSGASMEPTLHNGDILMCFKADGHDVSPGDIIIFDQGEKSLVKRVDEVLDGGEQLWVLGDNAAVSRDSRDFGAISAEDVRYVKRGPALTLWEAIPLFVVLPASICAIVPMFIGERIDRKRAERSETE